MPGVHSNLGASAAYRWFPCPGSVRMSQGITTTSSSYAHEGSCAHAVAELALNNGVDAYSLEGHIFEGFEDVYVDEEMCDAVQVYLDAVRATMALDPDAELYVETRFDLSHVHEGMFGTNDAAVYLPSLKRLVVFDYKHGEGIAVNVVDNKQMKYYAVGALTGKHNREIDTVELVIVQPRCPHKEGPVRRWEADPLDLLDFMADLTTAAVLTEDPDAELKAGDWCRFCPAAGICPTLRARAHAIADADFAEDGSVILSDPTTYSPEKLAKVLEEVGILKAWANRVYDFAKAEADAGRILPGYKLVPSRPRRIWHDEKRAVRELEEYGFGPKEMYETKFISVAAAEARLKKLKVKKAEEALQPLWKKFSGGTVLAPITDDRAPAKVDARSEFLDD